MNQVYCFVVVVAHYCFVVVVARIVLLLLHVFSSGCESLYALSTPPHPSKPREKQSGLWNEGRWDDRLYIIMKLLSCAYEGKVLFCVAHAANSTLLPHRHC